MTQKRATPAALRRMAKWTSAGKKKKKRIAAALLILDAKDLGSWYTHIYLKLGSALMLSFSSFFVVRFRYIQPAAACDLTNQAL